MKSTYQIHFWNGQIPSIIVSSVQSFNHSILIRFCRSDDESEYSEASEDETEDSEDLGSEEESGKDWSDLEREAAEDDANYSNRGDDAYAHKKKSSHDRRDKGKSSKNHR